MLATVASSVRGTRLLSGLQIAPTPLSLKYNSAKKALEILFDDGSTFTYPAELLRVESPSADSQIARGATERKVVHGRRHVGIMDIQQVGNYAIRIKFDDLHQSGIYSWGFLHQLGQHKVQRIRAYIHLLRSRGLSRTPSARPKTSTPPPASKHM